MMESEKGIPKSSIGIRKEKNLHKQVKDFFCLDQSKQEVPIDKWIVDIFDEGEIIEIQTRSFDKLRGKLTDLLPNYPVTIVYPMPKTKFLYWVKESGEIEKPHKSTRKFHVLRIAPELYKIKPFLMNPNLTIKIVVVDIFEYRNLDGYSQNKKRGSSRIDQVPTQIHEVITLKTKEDYRNVIPSHLIAPFTTKELAKAASLSQKEVSCAIQVLKSLGVIKMIGKRSRSYLYEITTQNGV